MPTATYTSLATVTLGTSATSVTFSNIPATYRDLILVINGQINSGGPVAMEIFLNGDTASNYSGVSMNGDGSSTFSSIDGSNIVVVMTNALSNSIIQLMDYSATDKHKTVLIRDNLPSGRVTARASRWANTAAVTQLQFTDVGATPITAGSTFSLYGVIA